MSAKRIIDYSRYRVAEAIVDQFRAGVSTEEIAEDFDLRDSGTLRSGQAHRSRLVELIVAAYDRRGTHRPGGGWK